MTRRKEDDLREPLRMIVPQSIPLNDLKRLYSSSPEAVTTAINAVIASGWWLGGRETEAFCAEFGAYLGAQHCIAVANGTDAIEIAIRALLETRAITATEVVTVANAGGYSTIACRVLGLVPVYADIEPESQLASIESVLSALSDETALVVATHLYGGVFDVHSLRVAMNALGFSHVPILEDCAQAHGARLDGKMAGTLGDIATFSFYPTKNLGAFGDAGAVVTADATLAAAVLALAQYGWSSKYVVTRTGGRNSRIDELQAAILRVLLPQLDNANERRRLILQGYEQSVHSSVRMVRSPHGTVAHLAVLLCESRDNLRRHLADKGIACDIHYPILDCDQPGWKALPHRFAPSGLEQTRRSISRLLTVPCFPAMTDGEIERVCGALRGWSK